MKTTLELAEMTEHKIHEILGENFELPNAVLYSVEMKPSGELEIINRAISNDIYHLLESSTTLEIAQASENIAVLTCGWAAPVVRDEPTDENEVAPSQHPDRRRVRLVVFANHNGVASVLRFSDSADEVVLDDGSARGSLADAVKNLLAQVARSTN